MHTISEILAVLSSSTNPAISCLTSALTIILAPRYYPGSDAPEDDVLKKDIIVVLSLAAQLPPIPKDDSWDNVQKIFLNWAELMEDRIHQSHPSIDDCIDHFSKVLLGHNYTRVLETDIPTERTDNILKYLPIATTPRPLPGELWKQAAAGNCKVRPLISLTDRTCTALAALANREVDRVSPRAQALLDALSNPETDINVSRLTNTLQPLDPQASEECRREEITVLDYIHHLEQLLTCNKWLPGGDASHYGYCAMSDTELTNHISDVLNGVTVSDNLITDVSMLVEFLDTLPTYSVHPISSTGVIHKAVRVLYLTKPLVRSDNSHRQLARLESNLELLAKKLFSEKVEKPLALLTHLTML